MDRADYMQEIKEAMALVKEYASTYRFLKDQFQGANMDEKTSILRTMNGVYEAWVYEIRRYAHLTEVHCREREEELLGHTIYNNAA